MITADEIKAAAIAANITKVLHHDCCGCGTWTAYRIKSGELYYDPNCDCTRYYTPPEPRAWQNAADWVNMQTNEVARTNILKKFGVAPTPKEQSND